jgi:hypothetical protein
MDYKTAQQNALRRKFNLFIEQMPDLGDAGVEVLIVVTPAEVENEVLREENDFLLSRLAQLQQDYQQLEQEMYGSVEPDHDEDRDRQEEVDACVNGPRCLGGCGEDDCCDIPF